MYVMIEATRHRIEAQEMSAVNDRVVYAVSIQRLLGDNSGYFAMLKPQKFW